ncbi:MAG: SUF system NifU family Fe-S cluster assembly protein [Deltaproteobacteria bacterium]|nr:SUF system NifU family Fe-S cluster assembly protein [Deltaproteobacteria bacterium]
MENLRELYQSTILDHNKKPRNFREIPGCDHQADGHNPLCGDKLRVFVELDGDVVNDLSFEGAGCAISIASASLMTDSVKGKKIEDIETLFDLFHTLLTTPSTTEIDVSPLGKLAVFSGVREFPMRVKCATLSWHTLRAALDKKNEVAKTE